MRRMLPRANPMLVALLVALIVLPGLASGAPGPSSAEATRPVPRTGQTACFDADGQPVDFEGSGQDCEQQRGLPWPDPRFLQNGDGTVTDLLTGLMWLRDGHCLAEGSWSGARGRITALNTAPKGLGCSEYKAAHDDWRLPEVRDLLDLVNAGSKGQADWLNQNGFHDVSAVRYWAATPHANSLNAWTVEFDKGVVRAASKLTPLHALAVRSAAGRGGKEGKAVEPRPAKAPAAKPDPGAGGAPDRFLDNRDGTVTDRATGLMWLKDPGCLPEGPWPEAIEWVRKFNQGVAAACREYTGRFDDWSLPNVFELQTVMDHGRDFPALVGDGGFFPPRKAYWSSTSVPGDPRLAYWADAFEGGTGTAVKREAAMSVWPVRLVDPSQRRERVAAGISRHLGAGEIEPLQPETEFLTTLEWPPPERFIHLGDGTSMDTLTGITWLTDANCFGKVSWKDAAKKLESLNRDPRKFTCEGLTVHVEDWIVPSSDDLARLAGDGSRDNAAWLTSQGIKNVQGGRDYWTASETPINLYYAYVVNLKSGKVNNYAKSFLFMLWPRRILQPDVVKNPPRLDLVVNTEGGTQAHVTPTDRVSLTLNLHTFGITAPADFWIFYESEEGQFWLTPYRKWSEKPVPLYQGALFNLKSYKVFSSAANHLQPGRYRFVFAVDLLPNGQYDEDVAYTSRTEVDVQLE